MKNGERRKSLKIKKCQKKTIFQHLVAAEGQRDPAHLDFGGYPEIQYQSLIPKTIRKSQKVFFET